MADAAAMKSASGAMRSLITMEANKRSLRKLLGLTIHPDLPPHLMKLVQDLDTIEASEDRRRESRH
jgi:hypothetical protein